MVIQLQKRLRYRINEISMNLVTSIREKHDLSQEDLARALNVSFTTINAWESGRRAPQERMRTILNELYLRDSVPVSQDELEANHGMIRSDAGYVSSVLDYGQERDPNSYTHGIGRWYGCLPSFLVRDLSEFISTDLGNNMPCVVNFSGSGTVALEMAIQGRQCTAIDVNPMAILLSKIKTTLPPPSFQLNSDYFDTLTRSSRTSGKLPDLPNNYVLSESKWICAALRKELLKYCQNIARLDDEYGSMLAAASLSSIIVDYCNVDKRCTNHYVFKENSLFSKDRFKNHFIKECSDLFRKTSTLRTISEFKEPIIMKGDACALPFEDKSVGLVFSHPPYGTTVNYYSVNRIQISILEAIENLRNNSGPENLLISCKKNDLSSGTLSRFNELSSSWVAEAARVLKPGGHFLTIIGDSRNNGLLSHPFTDVIRIGEEQGLVMKELFIWITNQKAGMHVKRKGNHIDHNYIIIMEKQ